MFDSPIMLLVWALGVGLGAMYIRKWAAGDDE